MSDIRAHYEEIRIETARLSEQHPTGYVFVTSERNVLMNSTPGTVSEVSVKIAARSIVDKVARIATPEEIADFRTAGQLFSDQMSSIEQRHRPGQAIHFWAKPEGKK
jgi:hypothetical protein